MKYLSFLFVILTFLSCTTKTVVLNEEYKGQKILGKKLSIIRLFDKPFISNIDDIVDDLGSGIPLDVYDKYFDENFYLFFKNSKCFKEVTYYKNLTKLNLVEQNLEINDKEKMKFYLPKDKSEFKIDTLISDYILFVDDLSILRGKVPSGTFKNPSDPHNNLPGITGNFATSGLYHNIYFALWDNALGTLISYGRVEDQVDVLFEMTKGHWDLITQNLGRKILNDSPFSVRSAIYNSAY